MTSWQYAYFFPGSTGVLSPSNALNVFAEFGLEFDSTIWELASIDEAGHLEANRQIRLEGPPLKELQTRLSRGEQFQVECRNRDILFTCSFDICYSNPHIVIGWSKRLFDALDVSRRWAYWRMLRKFAKLCAAKYVIIVDDPPDFFEDHFLEIDGRRILDNMTTRGNPYDIRAVWVDTESTDMLPEGICEGSGSRVVDGFREFTV